MQMQPLKGILMKNLSEPMQKNYARSSLLGCSIANSLHSIYTTPLIGLPCHSLHKWKRTLQVV